MHNNFASFYIKLFCNILLWNCKHWPSGQRMGPHFAGGIKQDNSSKTKLKELCKEKYMYPIKITL